MVFSRNIPVQRSNFKKTKYADESITEVWRNSASNGISMALSLLSLITNGIMQNYDKDAGMPQGSIC